MTLTIDAIYENGVIKPKEPLALVDGAAIRVSVSTVDEIVDPFEAVIGICDDGPDISLAARHDEFIYGVKLDHEAKP